MSEENKRITVKKIEVSSRIEYLDESTIQSVVTCKKVIKKWAYILHDKDVYNEEDEKKDPKKKVGTPKPPHWHIVLSFKDSTNMKTIANWFGLPITQLQKSKSGYFEDMARYLTHINAPDKYQYSPCEVKSNFDYSKFLEKGKIPSRMDEITNGIIQGEIRQYNYTQYITPEEFLEFKSLIDKAFEYRQDMLFNGERNLEVVYITGGSGTGKTTLAKEIAKNNGYSFYISSSDNDILDGYQGQDCLILDDLRGSSMKFSDFIKMIDNNTDSRVKSRYRNKSLTECKMIIITSIHSMKEFYSNLFIETDEPLLQFQRRCKTLIHIINEEYYKVYNFNRTMNEYEMIGTYANPSLEYILKEKEKQCSQKDVMERLKAKPYIILDLIKHEESTIKDEVVAPF